MWQDRLKHVSDYDMNQKRLNPEEIEELKNREPESGPPFQFREDQYYLAMFSVPLPKRLSHWGKGGDITGLVWRKSAEPKRWHMLYRFRHYLVSGESDPFEKGDKKNWYKVDDLNKTETETEAGVRAWLAECMRLGQMPSDTLEWLDLRGDGTKAMDIILSKKPHWMHLRKQTE